MTDSECPNCGREAAAVVDVKVLGTQGFGAVHGAVHPTRLGRGAGSGWRLYCHETEEGDSE